MKYVHLEHFSGTTESTVAHDRKHRLEMCLETISFPHRLKLKIVELNLRGDAEAWWDGVLSFRHLALNYDDFLIAFDKKYFPREALHQQKNEFEHLVHDSMSVREYERKFNQPRRFAGNNFDEEDHMRRFLDGMKVELRGRCSVVSYTSLENLIEKAVVQEKCFSEEQKIFKAAQPKSGVASGSQKRMWDQPSIQCHICGLFGHVSRNCRRLPRTQVGVPAAPVAANRNCYGCNQPGDILRDFPSRGQCSTSTATEAFSHRSTCVCGW